MTNYEKAKRLLKRNPDVVLLKYYNGYAKSISLKVLWLHGGDPHKQQKIGDLHRQLCHLARRINRGSYGGDIYNFNRA